MTTKDQLAIAKLYTEAIDTDVEQGDGQDIDWDKLQTIDIDSIYNQLEDIMFKLENSGMFKT